MNDIKIAMKAIGLKNLIKDCNNLAELDDFTTVPVTFKEQILEFAESLRRKYPDDVELIDELVGELK